jgi:hypothetical protein
MSLFAVIEQFFVLFFISPVAVCFISLVCFLFVFSNSRTIFALAHSTAIYFSFFRSIVIVVVVKIANFKTSMTLISCSSISLFFPIYSFRLDLVAPFFRRRRFGLWFAGRKTPFDVLERVSLSFQFNCCCTKIPLACVFSIVFAMWGRVRYALSAPRRSGFAHALVMQL